MKKEEMYSKKIRRKRLEENGLIFEKSNHFELFEGTIYYYSRSRCSGQVRISVPKDIFSHLKLKHKDKVFIAIKKIEGLV